MPKQLVRLYLHGPHIVEGYVDLSHDEDTGLIVYAENGAIRGIAEPGAIAYCEFLGEFMPENPPTEPPPEEQPAPEPAPTIPAVKLGTNLATVNEWTPALPFTDLMKHSFVWVSGSGPTWDDKRPVAVDDKGWPTSLLDGQIARARVCSMEGVPVPFTRVVVSYDGSGTIEYNGGTRNASLSGPGRDVIEFADKRAKLFIFITKTDPKNYIRNISVVPDNVPAGELFHPAFLERIKPFKVLRFMDWMRTNHTDQTAWSQRPQVAHASWQTEGVPVEVMVQLANRVGAHPWFTMSHLSDDNYNRQFANYVATNLSPELTVFLEYSNEIWNGIFPQARWCQQKGVAEGLSTTPWQGAIRWQAQRSVEIFKIWRDAFGSKGHRVVRVLSSQAANLGVTRELLGFKDAYKSADALAIAPYFGGALSQASNQARLEAMTVDQLMDELETTALPAAIQWMTNQAGLAKDFNLPLISYEGGQHLAALGAMRDSVKVNALFDAANRHPRMRTIYVKYLTAWNRITGGALFMHFSDCGPMNKFGRWGALEYTGQPRAEAPKHDALLLYLGL